MSKMYTSKKAGYSVLSGTIKEIADDRMSMVVSYRNYDFANKKADTKETHVVSMKPFDAAYGVKDNITVLGAIMGQDFQAVQFSKDAACFEVPNMSVVTGDVSKIRINEELNQDGTPKMRRSDGQQKKRHFDIFVRVPDGDKTVEHIIKVYDSQKYHKAGEPTNIEKYAARFESSIRDDGTVLQGFTSPEETPIRVTIATQPGQEFAIEQPDGSVYYGCSHMGINSIDMEFGYQRVLKKGQEQTASPSQESNKAATPEGAEPESASEKEVELVVDGFDEDLSLDFT